jgi:hypothetical protein
MGGGLPDGGDDMVRDKIHKVKYPRWNCEKFIDLMLFFGLNEDVPVSEIMFSLGLMEVGGGGLGPYTGRVNSNERRKGSRYRLVNGLEPNTYRLIELT